VKPLDFPRSWDVVVLNRGSTNKFSEPAFEELSCCRAWIHRLLCVPDSCLFEVRPLNPAVVQKRSVLPRTCCLANIVRKDRCCRMNQKTPATL
jgi:hypothetical protein